MKMKKHLFPLLAALLCMVMLMGCTAPVSYTHLDVYKRQDNDKTATQSGNASDTLFNFLYFMD